MSDPRYTTAERHAYSPARCQRCGRQHLVAWERRSQQPSLWTLEDEWCPNQACLVADLRAAEEALDLTSFQGRMRHRDLLTKFEERAEESSRERPAPPP